MTNMILIAFFSNSIGHDSILGSQTGVDPEKKAIKIIFVIEKIKNPDLWLLELYLNTI